MTDDATLEGATFHTEAFSEVQVTKPELTSNATALLEQHNRITQDQCVSS